jgi:septal ring factor EnvC (AmiA/AmiB activator)
VGARPRRVFLLPLPITLSIMHGFNNRRDFAISFFMVGLICSGLFSACKDYKPEMERAMMERDSIQLIGYAKDSSINAFLETLTQIESNLDSITQNQEAITTATDDQVEFNRDIRERINLNISIINDLLTKNRELVESLNTKLKNSNYKISSLQKMIDKLNADIAAKDSELVSLNLVLTGLRGTVDSLNATVADLRLMNEQKEAVITDKTSQINTAYWAKGTYKELKAANILNKQGGFLGLGKEQVLKKDFNNDGFTQIDITKTTEFEINNKSARILTNHPTGSYNLEKDAKGVILKLEILDASKFWKASKYLVIVTG